MTSSQEISELEDLLRGPLVRGIEYRRAIRNALEAGLSATELLLDLIAETSGACMKDRVPPHCDTCQCWRGA